MVALGLIPVLTILGAVVASWSQRVRDVFFFAMLSLAVVAERTDVNFFSEAWYRGTSRGIQITLVEMLAFGLLVGCWVGRRGLERRRFWPGSLGLLLLFFFYACISVVTSQPRMFGVFELTRMLDAILVFLASAAYVRSIREWTLLAVALGCAVGFEGAWAARQHLLDGFGRTPGTLDHANSLSMYLCLTPLLVAVAVSTWPRAIRWFCGVCAFLGAGGLILTYSRAGIPVFALATLGAFLACASWRMIMGRLLVRSLLALALAALVAAGWGQIIQRYSGATLEEEYLDPTVDGRGVYLRLSAAIARDHFFGVGLNNWSYRVSRTYGPRIGYRFADYDYMLSVYGSRNERMFAEANLAAPAHNLAALTLGELGVPGLAIFLMLWLRWFSMGVPFLFLPRDEPMRAVGVGILFSICGIFGQSLTEWVYRQTPILFTFYILLGALASLAHARRQLLARERAAEPAPSGPAAIPQGVLAAGGA
jgi:hypothetical protein